MKIGSLLLLLISLLVIIIILVKNINKNKTKKNNIQLINNYGKHYESSENELEESKLNYLILKYGTSINNQTIKDLNIMDVFNEINHTYSALGEEYLYYILNNPLNSVKELDERENIMQEIIKDKNLREQLIILFAHIGKSNIISIYEYIDYIVKFDYDKFKFNFLAITTLILSGVIAMIIPKIGIFLLLANMCINIIAYFRNKNFLSVATESINMVEEIINVGVNLSKLDISKVTKNNNVFEVSNVIKKYLRGTSFLISSKTMFRGDIDVFFDYIRMITHLDYVKLYRILKKIFSFRSNIVIISETIGKLEALLAITSYRESVPFYSTPIFNDKALLNPSIIVKNLYHPLIVGGVENSIGIYNSILLTGSNASGKSTFLKAIGVNCLLAQTINTTLSLEYKSSFFKVMTSMTIEDHIKQKESYYVSEIKTIKNIIDSNQKIPILCILDEVLKGTNTKERIVAATVILKYLQKLNTLCLVATHDIELTQTLKDNFTFYYFSENIENSQIKFDYKIKKGVTSSRNAIKLLELYGFDKGIVDEANTILKSL